MGGTSRISSCANTERHTLFRHFVALSFSLFASVVFADVRCDKQASKAKVEQCYKQLVTERKEALDEYYDAIMVSSNIPATVKATIDQEYKSFIKNVFSFCPDNSCVEAAMMEHIKDMYKQTRKYTVPE